MEIFSRTQGISQAHPLLRFKLVNNQMVRKFLVLICMIFTAFLHAGERQYFSKLRTVVVSDKAWDSFVEFEHKTIGDAYKSSECGSKKELLGDFPENQCTGSYFEYNYRGPVLLSWKETKL